MRAVCLMLLAAAGLALAAATPSAPKVAAVGIAPAATVRAGDPVFIGAGDIAYCGENSPYVWQGSKAEATALAVERLLPADPSEGVVFTAGDNAYMAGTAEQFQKCYQPTWGRFRERTRPVVGNHEYLATDAHGNKLFARDYYDYFGVDRAGQRAKGYYSYDLGEWHVIALNSELSDQLLAAQMQWAKDDLAQHRRRCTLAYWHRAVFTSGKYGAESATKGVNVKMREFFRALDGLGVDVIVNGHDHHYERFAAQDADRRPDPNGVVQFIVGTGGIPLRDEELTPARRRNSAAFDKHTWGVLKLTLHPDSYEYEFVPVASESGWPMFNDRSAAPVPCVD